MVVELPRILVVEDDEAIRSMLLAALKRRPLSVDAAGDGVEALELTARHDYAVILLDLMLPRVNGMEFLQAFRADFPHARSVVLVLTAFDEVALRRFDTNHAHAIVRKPFDVNILVEMVEEVALGYTAHTAIQLSGGAAVRRPVC